MHKVPQLNKQGAPHSPWGRWGSWWAGLQQVLQWVKLSLLIEQARDDGIEFFYKRGSAIPGLSGGSVHETATARVRLAPSVASAHGRWFVLCSP